MIGIRGQVRVFEVTVEEASVKYRVTSIAVLKSIAARLESKAFSLPWLRLRGDSTGLTSPTHPSNVTSIDAAMTFYYWSTLTALALPDSLVSLDVCVERLHQASPHSNFRAPDILCMYWAHLSHLPHMLARIDCEAAMFTRQSPILR